MTLYHIADVHIGVKNQRLGDKLFDIQYKHLKRLYEDAVKNNVDFVVIAGDLFDSNSVPTSLARPVFELIAGYRGVHTIIIPGGGASIKDEITGHDAYTKDSIYKRVDIKAYFSRDNIHLLTPDNPYVKIKDVLFQGGFFEVPDYIDEDALYHIAIVHGAFGKNEDEIDPKRLEDTPFDYIALGHYHKHRVFGKSAYAGAFIQFEFTKAKDLKSGFVKVEPGPELNIEYVPFDDAPRFLKVELLSKEDVDSVKDRLNDNTFVQIEGYLVELEDDVMELLKNDNVALSDEHFVIESDGTSQVFYDTLLKNLLNYPEEYRVEIVSLIMRFIHKKATFPEVKDFLQKRYEI